MTTTPDADRGDNDVFLRGRLAAEPESRVLPSGDEVWTFRLTVDRAADRARPRTRVDSIDCATHSARVRRCVGGARPGDELEISGALQRRFWRSAAGVSSRYEVVATAARVSRRRRNAA